MKTKNILLILIGFIFSITLFAQTTLTEWQVKNDVAAFGKNLDSATVVFNKARNARYKLIHSVTSLQTFQHADSLGWLALSGSKYFQTIAGVPWKTDTAILYASDTNRRVGIKTNDPQYDLDVKCNIRGKELRLNHTPNVNGMISFEMDDGINSAFNIFKPMFDAQNVKIGLGIITADVGTWPDHFYLPFLTWDQILELQSDGWEIISHSVTHPHLPTLTRNSIIYQMAESKRILESHGCIVNNFTYPFNEQDQMVRDVARQYYRSGRGDPSHYEVNRPGFLNTYKLRCIIIDDTTRLQDWKDSVDVIASTKGWGIFYFHAVIANDSLLNRTKRMINNLINYIKTKPLSIVTPNQALDSISNPIEINENFIMGANGIINTNNANVNTGFNADMLGGSHAADFVLKSTPKSLMFIPADTSMFADSTFGRIYSDGFVIDSLIFTVNSVGTSSVKLAVYYGTNWATESGRTAVVTAFNTITAEGTKTVISSFNNATVAAGNFVWVKMKGAIVAKYWSIQIKGHSL